MTDKPPTCINHGCNNPAAFSRTKKSGKPKWRLTCSECRNCEKENLPYPDGVTPFKSGKCANSDGLLGWKCPTIWENIEPWMKGTTQKYKDIELCVMCHKIQSMKDKDDE